MTDSRKRQSIVTSYLALVVPLLLPGCVAGGVVDATTGSALNGVTVAVVSGQCSSGNTACSSLTQTTRSISGLGTTFQGAYVFDAYGSVNANTQLVLPASGQEAIKLRFSRTGYQTLNVWHTPNYATISDNNTDYYYSYVSSVYLCPTGAADTDADGLCNLTEQRLGTDPSRADTDGDGIGDGAEVLGGNGVDYRSLGASPRHKDAFVEVDYEEYTKNGTTYSTKLSDAIITKTQALYDALNTQTPAS